MGKDLTKDDVYKAFEEIVGKKVDELREEFGRAAVERSRRSLTKVNATQDPRTGKTTIDEDEPTGLLLARTCRAVAAARQKQCSVKAIADRWKDKRLAEFWEKTTDIKEKALQASDFDEAGALLEDDFRNELIPLLRATAQVRGSGIPSVPMPRGTMTMPAKRGASTAYWVDEGEAITPSQPNFGRKRLTARKLAVLVPISNDWLRYGAPEFDALVRDDMLESATLAEDLAFLRSPGSEGRPKGLRYLADADNVVAATDDSGSVTIATTTSDLGNAVLRLENNDIPLTRPTWLFSPRTKWHLMTRRDGNNNLVWAEEMRGGTLMGYPYRVSTQVPDNLGGGGAESEVYFYDAASLIIGDAVGAEINTYEGGAYDNSGTPRMGISTDETVVRLIMEMDMAARQDGKEISVISEVDWTV